MSETLRKVMDALGKETVDAMVKKTVDERLNKKLVMFIDLRKKHIGDMSEVLTSKIDYEGKAQVLSKVEELLLRSTRLRVAECVATNIKTAESYLEICKEYADLLMAAWPKVEKERAQVHVKLNALFADMLHKNRVAQWADFTIERFKAEVMTSKDAQDILRDEKDEDDE